MVYNCVFWLNSFPHRDGVHASISPRTNITGQKITYDKHFRVEFGAYVQVHKKHNNLMEPRSSGAIALRPSGSKQGGNYFLSLHNLKGYLEIIGRNCPCQMMRGRFTQTGSSIKTSRDITFTNKDGNIITDDEEEEDKNTNEDEPIPVAHNHNKHIEINEQTNIIPEIQHTGNESEDQAVTGVNEQDDMTNNNVPEKITGVAENDKGNIETQLEEDDPDEYITLGDINIASEMNASTRQSTETEEPTDRANKQYNLGPRPKSTVQFTMAQSDSPQRLITPNTHMHIMLTQLNM